MMAKLSTRRYAAGLEPVGQARGRYWSVGDLLRVSVDLLTDGIMIGTGSLIASSLGFVLAPRSGPADIHRQSRHAGYTNREIAIPIPAVVYAKTTSSPGSASRGCL